MTFTAALVALVASNSPKPKTMKSDQTLILTGEGYGLEIAPEASTLRDELVTAAGAITTVTTNKEADSARAQIKLLADFRNLVEKSRKAVKEPVLMIGKDIDAKASEFGGIVKTEEDRLKKLVGDHALKVEAERRAEAERLRKEQAERERIQLEADEKARREAEEAARLQREAEAKAAVVSNEEEDVEAQIAADEAARKQAEAAAAEKERQRIADEQAKASSLSFGSAPREVSGVKFAPDFEVVDLAALYAAHPDLVTLTPKRSEILARIKAYKERHGSLPTVPGLIVTEKPVVGTR
jgi:NADH dehydrogenase/NADH:ubiquinone oxidoreductase subunit G